MNESMPRWLFLLLLLSLGLAACRNEAAEPPLAGASLGGPFSLVSHAGEQVDEKDFAGRYRLVYFGFTFCPDVCPVDLQTLSAGLRLFERDDPGRAARVQPIFISVDPARDTPDAMRRYVASFHPRLLGLTGSEEEIARVARDYGIYFSRTPPPEGGDPDSYTVDHSRMAVLYGPQGAPIAIVPHDHGPQGVAAELDRWVR